MFLKNSFKSFVCIVHLGGVTASLFVDQHVLTLAKLLRAAAVCFWDLQKLYLAFHWCCAAGVSQPQTPTTFNLGVTTTFWHSCRSSNQITGFLFVQASLKWLWHTYWLLHGLSHITCFINICPHTMNKAVM